MDTYWDTLSHAYGPASDIPGLLSLAETDLRPGHELGSTWFKLWSALCHQGDVFTASYASVPRLVGLAQLPEYRGRYDPILLAACIELARLEGRGPPLSPTLAPEYRMALAAGIGIAEEAARLPLDNDAARAYKASAAALAGDVTGASTLLDENDE